MNGFRDLAANEVSVRVGTVAKGGSYITALLYKDARVDANILDETVGADNWQCKFYECKGNLYCSLGIKKDEWVWKDDCGTESNTEAEKGEASDAFKRAGFKWGIGRELYTSPFIYIPAVTKQGIANYKLNSLGKPDVNLVCTFLKVADGKITGLNIENTKVRKSVFAWGDLGL